MTWIILANGPHHHRENNSEGLILEMWLQQLWENSQA
jgi:hypothetical protein